MQILGCAANAYVHNPYTKIFYFKKSGLYKDENLLIELRLINMFNVYGSYRVNDCKNQ